MTPETKQKNYLRKKMWIAKNPERWLAHTQKRYANNPFLRTIEKARKRARESGLEYDLTIDWARKRWTGKCEITGAEFKREHGKQNAFSPSLDRIDPSKGYTQDNCRFILWSLNRFKGDESDEVMIAIAKLLLRQ